MQKFDLHMHTSFCDGKDTAEAMVIAAIDAGLSTAGISGHSFTPHDQSYCMSREGTLRYIDEISELKQKYSDRIQLLLGVELDCWADTDLSPYDYRIGSAHYLFSAEAKRKRAEILAAHGGGAAMGAADDEIAASDAELESLIKFRDWCPVDDGPQELREFALSGSFGSDEGDKSFCDPEVRRNRMLDIAELYFETAGGIIGATDCDIVGHFDLITKFTEGWGFSTDGRIMRQPTDLPIFDTSDERYAAAWKRAIDRIFDDCAERYRKGYRNRLEAHGVLEAGDKPVFEINTGAISKGYRTTPYPAADQIEYIKSRGGMLILSSDSHAAGTICSGFSEFEKLK